MPGTVKLEPESVTLVRPVFSAPVPSGADRLELTFEVTNLHTAPGRNLTVTLPLTVRVPRSPA
jgi:hypothetical protein